MFCIQLLLSYFSPTYYSPPPPKTGTPSSLYHRFVLQIYQLVLRNVGEPLSHGFSSKIRPYEVVPVHLARGVATVDRNVSGVPATELWGELTTVLEGFLESHPEFSVEVGVDQGIEGGVEVAHPENQRDHPRRAVTEPLATQWRYHVPKKKNFYMRKTMHDHFYLL